MRKVFLSVFLLFLSAEAFSQEWILIEKAIGKSSAEVASSKSVNLSIEDAINILSTDGQNAKYSKNGQITFMHNGTSYMLFQPVFNRPGFIELQKHSHEISDKALPADLTQGVVSGIPAGMHLIDPDIPTKNFILVCRIQKFLNSKGFNLPIDGTIGQRTRLAIKKLYGFNCEGLAIEDLYVILEKLYSVETKKDLSAYKIVISKNNVPTTYDNLNITELNEKLIDLQNSLDCSVGDICANVKEQSGSISFDCEIGGVKTSITISSDGNIEFGFKHQGSASIFSINSNGKLTLTPSTF